MGFRVTTPVWERSKAKGSDLLVLLAISDSADNTTGDAYPSIRTLAELSRLSERAVQYSIRRLVEIGELSVSHRGNHKTSVYHVVLFDGRGAKIAPLNTGSGVQSTTFRGAIHDIQRCNPRHSEVQSTTNAIERARDTIEPVLNQPVLNQPEEPTGAEMAGVEPYEEPPQHPQFEHEFQTFKDFYPKIAGKFLNEDLAKVEFRKAHASRYQIIRGAKHYAASSIVKRSMEDGGRGIKYPNNFIRDGTWKDWQDAEVVENEDEAMTRRAKDELTRALRRCPEKMPDLSEDAKRLFRSLNTRWNFLAQMALDGRDICGPQTAGLRDVKVLAAEGATAHAL